MALGRSALALLREIRDSIRDIDGRRAPFKSAEKMADEKRARPWYVNRPFRANELAEESDHGPLPGIPARFMPDFQAAAMAAMSGIAADIEDDGRFVPIEHARNAYYLAEAWVGLLREAEAEHLEMHRRMGEERRRQEAEKASLSEAAQGADRGPAASELPIESAQRAARAARKALRKVPRAGGTPKKKAKPKRRSS